MSRHFPLALAVIFTSVSRFSPFRLVAGPRWKSREFSSRTQGKKILGDKVFGQEVKIEWRERDKYKRIVGEVFVGDRRICLEMVAEGYAWHYTQYSKDQQLAKAETEARESKKGLWADPNPIAPWEYRKGRKGDSPPDSADALFVTASGSKYHREGCRFLSKSKIPISIEDARKRYQPCSVCNPPK